ncbi:MAG: hypothetical protein KDD34_01695, partial [Bdellovibrionales bacterium]|nr:hypothetical protein [Bdellovibrionales bacterium]
MKQIFFSLLLTTTFACAQSAVSKKATSPCQPCMQLAAAADMIQKNLAGIEPDPMNTKTIDKQDQAVNDMKTILEGFLKRKDALETKEEIDALLGAWGGVARYDNTGAIPNYSPIFDKL